MAYVTNINCLICKKTKREISCFDSLCRKCRDKKEYKEKRKRLENFLIDIESLTLKEKIDRLEKVIHDENFRDKKEIVY